MCAVLARRARCDATDLDQSGSIVVTNLGVPRDSSMLSKVAATPSGHLSTGGRHEQTRLPARMHVYNPGGSAWEKTRRVSARLNTPTSSRVPGDSSRRTGDRVGPIQV